MMRLVVFFTLIVLYVDCQFVNPWIDTSSCLPTDSPAACNLKKKQCSPINDIIKPPGSSGLIGTITSCTNSSGTKLDPSFYMGMGLAFSQGKPESLMDNLSPDPQMSSSIRLCVLNSTGLIGSDLKFNRSAALFALAKQPLGPNIVVPILNALLTCPEPENYMIGEFMSCIRKACMENATATYPTSTWAFGAGYPGSGGMKKSPQVQPGGSKAQFGVPASGYASYGSSAPSGVSYNAAPFGVGPYGGSANGASNPGISPEVAKFIGSFFPKPA